MNQHGWWNGRVFFMSSTKHWWLTISKSVEVLEILDWVLGFTLSAWLRSWTKGLKTRDTAGPIMVVSFFPHDEGYTGIPFNLNKGSKEWCCGFSLCLFAVFAFCGFP